MNAEQYFIGQIFWNPMILNKVCVDQSDIFGEQERALFSAMLKLSADGSAVDELSVSKLSGIPLKEVLGYKTGNVITSTWEHYQKEIIDTARVRAIKKVSEKICESNLSADALIEMFDSATEKARSRSIFKPIPLPDLIENSIAELEQRAENKKLPGLTTGFRSLDLAFGGLQKTRLYYIGARPSQGKSTLLMNLALNCEASCIIFSAESSGKELSDRMIIRQGKINSRNYYNGTLNKEDTERVIKASSLLFDRKNIIIHDEPNITIGRLASIAHDAKKYNKIEVIFIDYIQLLTYSDGNKPKNEQVSEVSKRLKQLARELDVPVICAAQLRRDSEGKKPQLSDFSDSTQIERDADVAIMIYNIMDHEGNVEVGRETYLCIQKNRDGQLEDVRVEFMPQFMDFQEMSRSSSNQ
jgi:replicative DNA helicase